MNDPSWVDQYLRGALSPEDRAEFLREIREVPERERDLDQHAALTGGLRSIEPVPALSHDLLIGHVEGTLGPDDREFVDAVAEWDITVRRQLAELAVNQQDFHRISPIEPKGKPVRRTMLLTRQFAGTLAGAALAAFVFFVWISSQAVQPSTRLDEDVIAELELTSPPQIYADLATKSMRTAVLETGEQISPLCTAVVTENPVMSWRSVPGAHEYRVVIRRVGPRTPAAIINTKSSHVESSRLIRGQSYTWSVTAQVARKGWVSLLPGQGLPSYFHVLSKREIGQLDSDAKKLQSRDPVALAILYIRHGLLQAAQGELLAAAAEPRSAADRAAIDHALVQVQRRWAQHLVIQEPRDKNGVSDAEHVFGKPTIGMDGTIYLSTADGLKAISSEDGGLLWTGDQPGGGATPAIGPDGTLYYEEHQVSHILFAIDPRDGSTKWSLAVRDINAFSTRAQSPPEMGPDGTLYLAVGNVGIVAVDVRTAKTKWTFPADAGWNAPPVIGADGCVYFSALDPASKTGGEIVALTSDGNLRWRHHVDGNFPEPAIGPDGTIYVSTDAPRSLMGVYAFDPLTGTLKWSVQPGHDVCCVPAIAPNGTVYLTGRDQVVYALEPTRGNLLWSYKMKGESNPSSPTLGPDGTLYLGLGQTLYAFSCEGHLKWTDSLVGNMLYFAPTLAPNGKLYFGDDKGYFYGVPTK